VVGEREERVGELTFWVFELHFNETNTHQLCPAHEEDDEDDADFVQDGDDEEEEEDDDDGPTLCGECTYEDQTKTVKCAGCKAQYEVEHQLFVAGFKELYIHQCQVTGCYSKKENVSEWEEYLQWTVTSYVGQDMNASAFALDMTTEFDAAQMDCQLPAEFMPTLIVFLDVWEEQLNAIDQDGFAMIAMGRVPVTPASVGSAVIWKGGNDQKGIVRYVGPHATNGIPCIGIELTTPNGKSDGKVGIHQYCFAGVQPNCLQWSILPGSSSQQQVQSILQQSSQQSARARCASVRTDTAPSTSTNLTTRKQTRSERQQPVVEVLPRQTRRSQRCRVRVMPAAQLAMPPRVAKFARSMSSDGGQPLGGDQKNRHLLDI
jgi:hypothetical protein